MNLQHLFDEPVLESTQFDSAYEGHGDNVFRVRTASETVVVRVARIAGDDPFWEGMQYLFGVDPTQVSVQKSLNACLNALSGLRVPQILRQGVLGGRAWAVVECLQGTSLTSFQSLSETALEQFGANLAYIHRGERFAEYGNSAGSFRRSLDEFHVHVADTIQTLTRRFFADDGLDHLAHDMQFAVRKLPPPDFASFAHVDIDPTQYLTDGERITALIDTEAHVIAPRELDFIALEYVFGEREASAFARGYASVLPLPDLSCVRLVYRYLYYLFEIQDSESVDAWMGWPQVFANQ